MDKVRTFIALPLPDELKQKMARTQSGLRDAGADVKWELPDKFHITLKFLGEVSEDIIDELMLAIEESAQGISPFKLEVCEVGR